MSQFLNTNEISKSHLNPIFSWKGKTFTQITSMKRKNPGTITVTSKNKASLFLPNPLKIYRREIANPIDMKNCYRRSSLSIDEFNRPNGSIINTSTQKINGLVNTINDIQPNNSCEQPGTCLDFLSPSSNAKRRCRSSGIIKQTYNPSNNNASYYTNSNQYLVSRNRSFEQNQYNFIRVGDPLLKPGPGLAASNIYTSKGLPVCPKYYISTDCYFNYQWIDGAYYTVNVPHGYYSIDDFKNLFQVAMSQNYHFVIQNNNGSKVFLINIIYDDVNSQIQIQFTPYDNTNFPASDYSSDIRATWTGQPVGTKIFPPNKGPGTSLVPGIRLFNNALLPALGISSNSFPIQFPSVAITTNPVNNTQTYTTTQTLLSTSTPGLRSIYNKIYYKPSNSKFGQQGAVTSSSLITRIKYDTINTAAYRTSGNIYNNNITIKYGSNISNALAYGVSENPYTMKDKIGYPNISYPSFLKYSKVQRKCTETSISGGVKFNT